MTEVGVALSRHIFRQFVVRSLARQQRPHAPLSPSFIGSAVLVLSVAVPVVAQPSRPLRQILLQHPVHHLQRIRNQRIVRAPHAIAHQLQETTIDNLARLKFIPRARWPVRQLDQFLPATLVRIHLAALRRPDPHVVPLHLWIQHAVVRHRPVFEMPLDPVGIFLQKLRHLF